MPLRQYSPPPTKADTAGSCSSLSPGLGEEGTSEAGKGKEIYVDSGWEEWPFAAGSAPPDQLFPPDAI